MKKFLVLSALFLVSACACMNSDEPIVEERKVVFRSYQTATPVNPADCDFVENNTCYRYVSTSRYVEQAPRYMAPAPRYVRPEPQYFEPKPVRKRYTYNCCEDNTVLSENDCNACKPTYRSTREPVEVVYKKTTYKTVYEPKTTSSVSYEKEPFSGQVEVDENSSVVVETTTCNDFEDLK